METNDELKAPGLATESLQSLAFRSDYRITMLLEPDGRLREVIDAHGVDNIDFTSMRELGVVETTKLLPDGEERAAVWTQRLEDLRKHRRPISYTASAPGTAPGGPETIYSVATPIPAADGTLDSILVEAEDRGSAFRIQRELEESEERFKQLAESLPQMVWVSGPDGAVVYFSPQWEAFTGRTQEALLGTGFRDLIHPDDLGLISSDRGDDGAVQAVQFRLKNVAGEYRWMEADYRVLTDQDGQVVRWVGGTTDITERRRKADAARELEEQLRVAMAVTGMGRYSLYFRDEVMVADSRLSAILGVDVNDVMRNGGLEGLLGLLHEDDVDFVRASIEAAAAHGPDYDVEYRMWRPREDRPGDPELRWVAARGRVEFDDAGPVRMVGVIEDITQRKLEEEARLRWQKREEIGSLAGGIAHDFNNVISAILSNAALAETELKFGVSPATSLTEIARGAERAADIVKRLLAFSREDEPVRDRFDLSDVVAEACALVGSSLQSDTTLLVDAAPDLPVVFGSSTELHQVVVNLVANARHAVDGRSGQIRVDVDTVQSSDIGAIGSDRTLRIRVEDTGTGIPDAILPRIFDPFFTTRPAGKGTGLGLAAARTIVRGHGGSIAAENVDGGGARITVLLPAADAGAGMNAGSGTAVSAAVPATELPMQRILGRVFFVDDEPALVRLAERALPIRGYAVRAFTDPVHALDALAEEPDDVDALVTDLSMPGLSGLELIQRVRALRPDLPVVLSSGFLTAANREEANRYGVDVIIPKPCSIDDLAGALIGLLDRTTGAVDGDGAVPGSGDDEPIRPTRS